MIVNSGGTVQPRNALKAILPVSSQLLLHDNAEPFCVQMITREKYPKETPGASQLTVYRKSLY